MEIDSMKPPLPSLVPLSNILQEAHHLTTGERRAKYGPPSEDYGRVAEWWTTMIRHKLKPGQRVTPADAIMGMIFVKMSREVNCPNRDNRTDGAGYFGVLDTYHSEAKDCQ